MVWMLAGCKLPKTHFRLTGPKWSWQWLEPLTSNHSVSHSWAVSSEFGTYCLCMQPCSLARTYAARSYKQWVKRNLQTEKPDPWPLWMTEHAQLKFVMTECSKTQIRLTCHSCICVGSKPTQVFMWEHNILLGYSQMVTLRDLTLSHHLLELLGSVKYCWQAIKLQ